MKKVTQKHTTYIDEVKKYLDFLNKNLYVKKIVLGRIVVKDRATQKVTLPKIILDKKCLLLKINSKKSNQELRIYSENLNLLESSLRNNFDFL